MFKKKIEERNEYDSIMTDYLIKEGKSSRALDAAVQDVIIKNGVIDLYPSGADKEKAKVDLQTAKNRLLCAIGKHDSILSEIERYYVVNKYNFVEYSKWYPGLLADSHKMVEIFYRNFIRNRQRIKGRNYFRSFSGKYLDVGRLKRF